MSNPWFRLYAEAVDDDKLRLLAFEDRWHYIALLCLKCDGLLDAPDSDLRTRRIAVKLGVQVRELDEIKRRLMGVDLVNEDFQPTGWDKRQFESDSSRERTRKYRERMKKDRTQRHCDGDVTVQDTDTDTDTDKRSTTLSSSHSTSAPGQKLVNRKVNGFTKAQYRTAATEILEFLNTKASRAFRPTSTNLDTISARLVSLTETGESLEEATGICRAMVVWQLGDWKGDPKMEKYLRPETLFNRTKFETYVERVYRRRMEYAH